MSLYDSISLLGMFNRKAGRPPADAIPDASKYQRLAESQNRVIGMMASIAPHVLYPKVAYGSLPTLTTTDNQVFTFGPDADGYAVFPLGQGGIYPSLAAIPDSPWVEGRDYINEGTQIRILNNGTYTGPLYWYGVMTPADITATMQPVLFPEASRELIVIDAVRLFALEGMRNVALAGAMQAEWDGDAQRPGAWATWCLAWKTQYRLGGALRWTGRQVALASQSSL